MTTPLPEALVGAEPLPGWRGSPTAVVEIHLDGYVCERVAIDRFERGPVGVAFEYYAANGGPPACQEGSWTTREVLHALWVSDAEIAAHLAGLGLPAHLAAFDLTSTTTASVAQERLTIAADGAGVADLQMQVVDGASLSSGSHTYRYVTLAPDGGMRLLDLDLAWQALDLPPAAVATMPNPFLASTSGSDVLPGRGATVFDAHGRGAIQLFQDPECERPL